MEANKFKVNMPDPKDKNPLFLLSKYRSLYPQINMQLPVKKSSLIKTYMKKQRSDVSILESKVLL